jgi:DNA-binding XRE family transcriptional regulator
MANTRLSTEKYSGHALTIDMGNIDARQLIARAYTLSRASQRDFARTMGVGEGTLSNYLSGTYKPTNVAAMAACFAAMCFGVAMHVPRLTH